VGSDDVARRRRRTVRLQRYAVNPPMKLAVMLGLARHHMLVETRGRTTGKRRRTVVGYHREDDVVWVVAEQGRHAGYVRNLQTTPQVRLRLKGRWVAASARAVDDDDAQARLRSFARPSHIAAVERFGTSLLSVRFDLGPSG
jgi:deazaflavin-dependent oxidoreductase (nitroreductase family)